ncbi:MAG TPA: septal ring lytic transglycosylase RlpA family protein [Polyangiaceae bacterium]|nr:septal ring lytic transglycosylase RlpA family protein [Polyangiaceae bacterium]
MAPARPVEPPERVVPARPLVAPSWAEPQANDGRMLSEQFRNARALQHFRGRVSYYSDSLSGRPTASGEPYQPARFTAAHRSLPFGSVVRVVREDTGEEVYVRINDRGPFVRGRILDLSGAAARQLGLLRRGVMPVRADVVLYGERRDASKPGGKKRKNKARPRRRPSSIAERN